MKTLIAHCTLFVVLFLILSGIIGSGVATGQTYYNGLPVITRTFDEMEDDSIFVPLSPGSKMMYSYRDEMPISDFIAIEYIYSEMREGKLYVGFQSFILYHYDSLTHIYTSLAPGSPTIDTVMDFKTPNGGQFNGKPVERGTKTIFGVLRNTFKWIWNPYPGPHNPPVYYYYAAGVGHYYTFSNASYGGGFGASTLIQALYNRGDHYEFFTVGKPEVWVNPPEFVDYCIVTIPVKVDHGCNAPLLCKNYEYGTNHFTKNILWQGFYANQTDTIWKNDIRIELPCTSTTTQLKLYLDTAKMRTHDYYCRVSATDSGLIPQTVLSPDTGYYRIQYTPPVGITCEDEMPEEFSLEQNYPNPFNPVTTVAFTMPEQGLVSIIVYDLLGREVLRPLHSVMPAGSHTISIDASSLAAGAYFYALRAGEVSTVRKMLLLK